MNKKMAKYLRTSSISAELENLIRDARKVLYIISPYLKLSDQIKELLNDKEREKVDVRIIFGKQELAPDEMSFLENLRYVRLYFSKNLHAKCYLNEHKMIIASMNLYEFSQQNNREMGILIDKENENDKTKNSTYTSNLKTTKDLSKETDISSRKINVILTDKKLMYKKENDWLLTKKGKEFGGIEKAGQYGQFIVWPDAIKKELK